MSENVFLQTETAAIEEADVMGTKPNFATVTQYVSTGTNQGVRLRFDGESAAGQKIYKIAKNYTPVVGDRVLVLYVSGTTFVPCAVRK